ncbi:MAG: hypothetical protein HKM05_10310 [Spirochaetales bacterium]|nr:hypothetical protein [Spirochaetales bacterium]
MELVRRGGAVVTVATVSQDLSPSFKLGVEMNFPQAKIVYDRFHVMKMITKAAQNHPKRFVNGPKTVAPKHVKEHSTLVASILTDTTSGVPR